MVFLEQAQGPLYLCKNSDPREPSVSLHFWYLALDKA